MNSYSFVYTLYPQGHLQRLHVCAGWGEARRKGGWGGLRSVCGVGMEEEGRGEAVKPDCVVCLGGTWHVVGSHEAGGGDWQKGDGHRHATVVLIAEGEIDKCEGAVVLAEAEVGLVVGGRGDCLPRHAR